MHKNILVTGAAKGIGAAFIKEFAKQGYNVVINYLSSKKEALELKKYIENLYNVKVVIIKADITLENDVQNMFEIINKTLGKLDVLINNAAYAQDNNYLDKTKEEFMRVLEVNIFGTFLVTKYASKYMDDGTIINISSTDALDTFNEISMDYCASKAGVNSLTKTYSIALPNIKVISIMLPWVKTEAIMEIDQDYLNNELKRIGQNRLLEPVEVAKIVWEFLNNKKIKSGDILKVSGDYFEK